MFCFLRLQAQLLQTTWQQTELQIESDLAKLKEWARDFDLFVSQQALVLPPNHIHIMFFFERNTKYSLFFWSRPQGLLDWKYLNDRFQKGKKAIQDLMETKHKLLHQSSLTLCHSSVVTMQAAMGSSGLLIQK